MLHRIGRCCVTLLPFVLATATFAEPRIDITALPQDSGPTQRVPAEILHGFEPGTFLESVAVDTDGTLFFTEASRHLIYTMAPEGEPKIWHESAIHPTGLAFDLDRTLIATGVTEDDVQALFVFTPEGKVAKTIALPDAVFLNGAAFLVPGTVLAADSALGRIYQIDLTSGEVAIWLEDDALAPNPERSELLPGANGIKLYDGAVYVSNSSRMSLLRILLQGEDQRAGAIETVVDNIVLDDFTLATDGTVYGTTHIYDSVVRIEPDGTSSVIATAEDGVAGSTDVAFASNAANSETLYVVGDGGTYLEPDAAGPVNIVALRVGEPGLPLMATFSHLAYPGHVPAQELSLVRCLTAEDSAAAREANAPAYTRFLELNMDAIVFAGQAYANGRDEPPSARHYFIEKHSPEEARRMMEGSPYFLGGVYSRCEAVAFDSMLGSLMRGVAWPEKTSAAR
nr:hypothetical protein [uncultured Halomonas sp.]